MSAPPPRPSVCPAPTSTPTPSSTRPDRSGADAVHPGYGFLSENAAFADAVSDAGLIWVGPSPQAIAAMGDKLAAKAIAAAAGVPMLASSPDPTEAADVGFPLIVKAAAGGGGKGMRLVRDPADLDEAVAAARREAEAGFGDPTVFIERYVARARHVEIQILGDRHGNLVHLGERDCSIQRRHQKIIEEAPSPALDPARRAEMGAAALRLAAEIGYESAGTVEFLVDDDTGEYFFLEVNTRLQVEHPVTEAVTGIDLVREQLRIAAGESLGYDQDEVTFGGHAIEARLYAEDTAAGFLPATGTLSAWDAAAEPAVRWDSGVEAGSVVGLGFDPMLAKVIAHAPTRAEAAARLALALERLHVGGVTTNRGFLVATLRAPVVRRRRHHHRLHRTRRSRPWRGTDVDPRRRRHRRCDVAPGREPSDSAGAGRPAQWLAQRPTAPPAGAPRRRRSDGAVALRQPSRWRLRRRRAVDPRPAEPGIDADTDTRVRVHQSISGSHPASNRRTGRRTARSTSRSTVAAGSCG